MSHVQAYIHMQHFLLPTNLVIVVFVHWAISGVLYEPQQCQLFWDYIPEYKLFFASIWAARLVHIESDQYRSCSTVKQGPAVGATPSTPIGEQPKTALWLWVREITWYLYTRGVRGRMKATQRWFKVTRELCHEWFHHFRHHRQNKPSAQLPQPTRSQTGKWEEFWDWTPISPGELIRQSLDCPGQKHSQQEVLSAHCSR